MGENKKIHRNMIYIGENKKNNMNCKADIKVAINGKQYRIEVQENRITLYSPICLENFICIYDIKIRENVVEVRELLMCEFCNEDNAYSYVLRDIYYIDRKEAMKIMNTICSSVQNMVININIPKIVDIVKQLKK